MNKLFLMAVCCFHLAAVEKIGEARIWLEKKYLPSLKGNILSVGVGSYTVKYTFLTKTPKLFETVDFALDKAQFGSPFGHYVAEFKTFNPGKQFDHISMFGVMGHPQDVKTSVYSILDEEGILEAFEQAHKLLKLGGTLQLGPNCIAVPEQNAEFWLNQFRKEFFQKYETLYEAVGVDNVVWWGRKMVE